MVKSGLGLFAGRRKSSSAVNTIDEAEHVPVPDVAPAADAGSGGFRLMTTTEAEARKKEEKRRAQEKAANKFRPFSGFSNGGNKGRNHSFDDDSLASSKRDSKSSNGTQSSRPYNNGQFGSTSTLPSSADTDPSDNIFAIPRPHIAPHHSSPSSYSMSNSKKQLPALPSSVARGYGDHTSPVSDFGRVRAMTSSSYASTAKPPTLDGDMNFGSTSFDDMFSGLDRKDSPEPPKESPGRSLLAGKRTFQAEPITIDRKLEVEVPLASWDSRGSGDNLMSSPRSPDNDSPPPPVPPHKYSHSHSQYAPVASHSPDLGASSEFEDTDAKIVRQSIMARKSAHESSPERNAASQSSSSAPSLQTPLSSRPASDKTTPKVSQRPLASPLSEEEDDLFTPAKPKVTPAPKPAPKDNRPQPQPPVTGDSGRRVMTQAEFRAQQQRQITQPQEESSDEDEYEDEEEAEERAQQEAIARRKKQQMDMARETMRRTTTAPANLNQPDSVAEPFSMGFPSETSLKADEWEDEDIPLGILAQHGFPSTARNKPPVQPANAMPSYFPNSTLGLPDRPASAGALGNRASQAFRPVFARNLPDDPHTSFIGGGLIRPSNRESLGFNRGPASVAGDQMGVMPMGYSEPQLSAPSLVEQIHMRDMSKQKYMGGASSKKPQQPQGPFTGLLGAQMNGINQSMAQKRISQMPGMNGMSPMMNGMNMMGMPMMGMNHGMNGMAYPMGQNELLHMQQMQQMQQLLAQQQMQIQQMQAFSQQSQDPRMSMLMPQQGQDPRMSMGIPQPGQDPRMSMALPGGFGGGNSFLNVPGGPVGANRPMSMMSFGGNAQQPPRPFSTPSQVGNGFAPAPLNGYTPSIAPSERSNIGLSARYRPVATHQDAMSTVSSMTLQASGGATQNGKMVKGILKNKPAGQDAMELPTIRQPVREEEDDDGWGKMAARKSRMMGTGSKSDDGLRELVRGVDTL